MKAIKFVMIAAVALFTVNFANAQTSPAKATVKTVPTAKAEKKAIKVEPKVDTVKKEAHKATKAHKKG